MPHSDEYRAKAVECLLQADRTPEPEMRDLFFMLAMAYARRRLPPSYSPIC